MVFLSLQCLVPLLLHLLEHPLVVGQPFLLDDPAYLPLYPASDHPIDRVLLPLHLLPALPLLAVAQLVYYGVERQLLY